jgi:hypothetical protein
MAPLLLGSRWRLEKMNIMRLISVVVIVATLALPAATWAAGNAAPTQVLTFQDLTPEEAPAVLSVADQMVWDRTTGVAVAEVPVSLIPRLERVVKSNLVRTEKALGFEGTVRTFLPGYGNGRAEGREGAARYAVMKPVEMVKPPALQVRDRVRPERRNAVRTEDGSCLYQGFETLPIWYENGGDWWHYQGGQPDNNAGDYFWLDSDCDAFDGSWSADAVLGGDLGISLPCGATYDYNTDSWMEYAPWITCAYQAPGAELDFYGRVQSEANYDFFYYLASVDGINYYGYSLSGDFSDTWYLFSKDLSRWTSLGDLTTYPHFALAFVFQSDDVNNAGFGARVDNISLYTTSIAIDRAFKVGNPFRLKIYGAGFLPGAWVYIDGAAVPKVKYKGPNLIVAKKGRALKAMIPRGTPVCVTVVNPNGGTTPCYMFTR